MKVKKDIGHLITDLTSLAMTHSNNMMLLGDKITNPAYLRGLLLYNSSA